MVSGWHRRKGAYKRERSGERCCVSSRTTARYLKRGESCVTEQSAADVGWGRQVGEGGWEEEGSQRVKGGKEEQFHE
jgi:hypothetical protein